MQTLDPLMEQAHESVDESSKLNTEKKSSMGTAWAGSISLRQGEGVCYSSQGLASPYQGWCE